MAPVLRAFLLLVGAGHSHLHLLAHAERLTAAGYQVTLVAPGDFRYSGVASASAAGDLSPQRGQISVTQLARAHGVDHVVGRLTDLDLARHRARTDFGAALRWDVLSLNLGSVASSSGIQEIDPGVVRIKPLQDLAFLPSRVEAAIERAQRECRSAEVTIVGGGASGIELAGHLSARGGLRVRLIEAGPTLLPQGPESARRQLQAVLNRRGVIVTTNSPVCRMASDAVHVSDGRVLFHDVAVLATGLAADPLVAELGLTAGRAGAGAGSGSGSGSGAGSGAGAGADGIPVSATLQYLGASDVYAVGDCAHFTPSPLAKIGVHGVRQGPVLLDSLIRRAAGAPLPSFVPSPHPLQILDLGGGVGLAWRGQRWWCGRSARIAKRWIDRRWLATYR
ncbi:MAG: FAD-dependent oxidoreductase [Ornithinimicrobium sp.]